MKLPHRRNTILFSIAMALFFLLACNSLISVTPEIENAATSTATQSNEITAMPTLNVSTPTVLPTTTKVPQDFFAIQFDEEPANWSQFSINGENSVLNNNTIGINVYTEDGFLIFDINRKLSWIYSIYNGFDYDNVRIDANIENRGVNTNNVSLICRYSEEDGWFEFNVTSSGLYNIYFARPRFDGYVSYTEIASGGSNDIKPGIEANMYTAICNEDNLTLMINEKSVREVDASKFDLPMGKIGISVSSFMDVPVKVKFNSVTISLP